MSNWLTKLFSSAQPASATAARVDAEARKNNGNARLAAGELELAADCYRQAIALDPHYAEAYNNLGFVALAQGRFEDAERHLNEALALDPDLTNAYINLATLQQHKGEPDKAAGSLRQLLVRTPDSAQIHNQLGDLLQSQNRLDEACVCYQDAIGLDPEFVDAHINLGTALQKQGRIDEALACFQHVLAIKPDRFEAPYNIGVILENRGMVDEALSRFETALALRPDFAGTYNYLGNIAYLKGDFDGALKSFRQALALDPRDEMARSNVAFALLARGHLDEGWNAYVARFYRKNGSVKRSFPQQAWEGEALEGKALLIWGEQGVGDEILQAGLFQEMIDRSRRCVIECTPKLVPLFARSFPTAQVVPRSDPPHPATLADIDVQCAAGSLARWLRPSVASFPSHRGYLSPDPDRVAFWRSRLDALGPGLKVGFAWRSKILSNGRHLYCTTLDLWGPIFAVPGVHFINLQYDQCTDELADARRRFGVPLHAFDEVDLFNDLAEAAAFTQALDLVVSAPTASSFLAGAVGVHTWIMTYGIPWQTLGTNHFPWFPAMRLFSRRWDQEWDATIETIADELRAHRASNASQPSDDA